MASECIAARHLATDAGANIDDAWTFGLLMAELDELDGGGDPEAFQALTHQLQRRVIALNEYARLVTDLALWRKGKAPKPRTVKPHGADRWRSQLTS